MPKARTRRQRALQLELWLAEHFPAPFPVVIKWKKRIPVSPPEAKDTTIDRRDREAGYFGQCYRVQRKIYIELSDIRLSTFVAVIETLMHEWAHAVTLRHAHIENERQQHDDEWALAYGRIYRAWVDEEGSKDAREYA